MPRGRERSIRAAPRWVVGALALTLLAQVALQSTRPAPRATPGALPAPPPEALLRLASLGEETALARVLMLWLQAFDYQTGTRVPYRDLDYGRLGAWLDRIIALDPAGQYPLATAARIYAEVPDAARQRVMLDLIYRRFLEDPDRRWPWLAHATLIAKHRLRDLPLAREYAIALQQRTRATDVPVWVRQMEPFILEEMNEIDAARILIGGLLQSGQVKDARDAALLAERLKALEARQRQGPPSFTPPGSPN